MLLPSVSKGLFAPVYYSNCLTYYCLAPELRNLRPFTQKRLFFFASNQIVNHLRSLPSDTRFP
jgi:hypothetical protein